jgi:drug/metabolite transporter (DMT)-like permease
MTHGHAIAVMAGAATLWSIAGVVARQLQAAQDFEVTFWRSAFTVLSLALLLAWLRGVGPLWRALRTLGTRDGRVLWVSGLCWSVMFTAFMLGITLTTVANVLVTMALAPLLTALLARLALGHRLPSHTWAAILLAGAGIAWMYGSELRTGDPRHWAGIAVALCVPVASAVNWTVMQRERARPGGRAPTDLMPAVLLGAALSALFTLLPALPLQATATDLAWLGLLGALQLAVPCLMAVAAARVLSAPEVALLALLEVVLGVAWAWLGAGEAPAGAVLGGGTLVLLALAGNAGIELAHRRLTPQGPLGTAPGVPPRPRA